MTTIQKILLGTATVAVLGGTGFFVWDRLQDNQSENSTNPQKIVESYEKLLEKAEKLKQQAGDNCEDSQKINQEISFLEKQLNDLAKRKKAWLDSVPPLPEINIEVQEQNPKRPGSEVPELDDTAYQTPKREIPPLPEIDESNIEIIPSGPPGSEVPELSSDVPPLPEINIEVVPDNNDDFSPGYIPELPEPKNTGRPGSEVPELSSDVPPLPEINAEIIDYDEPIYKMDNYAKKISDILQALKELCKKDEATPAKPKISDKCEDACQRHKKCASYGDDVTAQDLKDAYDACMEECAAWPKEKIKCINSFEIKKPNDCISFVNCELPKFYEEKYLPK